MEKGKARDTKFITLFKGVILSYFITAIFLILLSFALLKFNISKGIINGGIVITYIISNFLGGYIVGKVVEAKKYIWGMFLGILYFTILMLVSMAINKGNSLPTTNMLVVFIICSISGMIGGMLS